MIEGLLIILLIGFLVYFAIRHPIKSVKTLGVVVGLFVLGLITISLIAIAVGVLII